ncbi:MAG TPA: hypothetical protein VNL95_04945 [Dehalococcoidia bacterium]|nr:hypothetical protein [Dehalococcoidia bacterium]
MARLLGWALALTAVAGLVAALALSLYRAQGEVTAPVPPPAPPPQQASASPTPAPAPSPTPLPRVLNPRTRPQDFHAGAAVLLYGTYRGWQDDLVGLYADLAGRGVNALSLNFPVYTASATADAVYAGPGTPGDADLTFAIETAHAMGFTVFLRPLLSFDPGYVAPSGEWRGSIRPASLDAWFASYGSLLGHYARLGQATGVEMLSIGAELKSLSPYSERWRGLIAQLRSLYRGQLTYSANWDELDRVAFWDALDIIAVDAFFDLQVGAGPTVAELVAAWGRPSYVESPAAAMQRLNAAYGKPVLLAELGMPARSGFERHPWADAGPGPATAADLEAQARYFEAAFLANEVPHVQGFYVWAISPGEFRSPSNEGAAYNPWGRPAGEVIARYYRARTSAP